MKLRETAVALLVAAAVYAVAVAGLISVSKLTGPAVHELRVLAAIDAAVELVKGVSGRGPSELLRPDQRASLESGVLVIGGAWSKASLGRIGVLDPLTAMRLPWLLLGALVPLSLYLIVRPSRGRAGGLMAAALCGVMPRFSHAVVVLDEGAVVASMACVVIAAHVRAMGPARSGAPGARWSLAWAAVGAVALGFGASLSLGVLWVVPLIVAHFVWARRRIARRWVARGRVPIPALLILALPIAPLILLALSPALWKASPALVARVFLAPLEPTVVPSEIAGRVVTGLPVPGHLGWAWLVHTVPLAVLLALFVGLSAIFHEHLARRFASGSLRPARDRHALGALALIGIAGWLLGVALMPDVLTTFPPRVVTLLPLVAIASALGLMKLASFVAAPGLRAVFVGGTLTVLGSVAVARAATASVSGGLLTGGARSAARVLPMGDGSEVAVLARSIDALGKASVSIETPPQLPAEIWSRLVEARRMKTRVTVQPNAELVLQRGRGAGEVVGEVRRDGFVSWTLFRTGP